jgi:hypothetical protein
MLTKIKRLIKLLINYHPIDMPNWKKLLKKKHLFSFKKQTDKNILIATMSGGIRTATSLESMLAVALSLKGAKVTFLLCDNYLPLCIMKTMRENISLENNKKKNEELCQSCLDIGKSTFKKTGLDIIYSSKFISKEDKIRIKDIVSETSINEIMKYNIDNIDIGEQIHASLCRYYAVENYSKEPDLKKVTKDYFLSALLSHKSFSNITDLYNFDLILSNHGFYIPQGVVAKLALIKNIDLVTWTPGARKNTFIFSHNKTYNKDIVEESVNGWKNIDITTIEKTIDRYLNSKVTGEEDYAYHKKNTDFLEDLDFKKFLKHKNIDTSKKLIGMTTNVIWDAQLHYDNTIFRNMMGWVLETISYFIKRNDLNLIIRIHPTEINADRPARERVKNEILKVFPNLPSNILIIDSSNIISTYKILDTCNAILTYGTKMDIEYSARGFPIIAAGEALTKNKNLVFEPKNVDEYYSLLNKLPFLKKLDEKTKMNAKKFAYYYFFKRSIKINTIFEQKHKFPPFNIDDNFLNILSTGKDQNFDMICDAIINKKVFVAKN